MTRRHRSQKRRRNPSGSMAGKAALAVVGGAVLAGVVDKYLVQMTVPPTGGTASLTPKTARILQVAVPAAVAIGAAAYNQPTVALVSAMVAAPGAKPAYDALRAPAVAASPYMAGLPAYR